MSGDVGNSSGETKAVGKKKLHHLNPRRRNKLKQKVPDLPLSEEEKHRRAEQKKRRELAMKLRAEGRTYSSETFNRKKRKAAGKADGQGRPKKKVKVKSSQRNKAPYNVIILPIAWHQRKEETARILAVAESAEQMLAAAGITSRIDDTDNYTPGQKMKYWELRGVRVRLEIGPKESLANTAVLALAAGAPGEVASKSSIRVKEPMLVERVKAALQQLGEKIGSQQQQQQQQQKQQDGEGGDAGAAAADGDGSSGDGQQEEKGEATQQRKKRPAAAAAAEDGGGGKPDQQQQQRKKKHKKHKGDEDAAAADGLTKEERQQQKQQAKEKLKQKLSVLVQEDGSDGGQPGTAAGQQQQQQEEPPKVAQSSKAASKAPKQQQQQQQVFESADALEDDFEVLVEGDAAAAAAPAAAGRKGKKFQNKQRGGSKGAEGGAGDVQLGLSAAWESEDAGQKKKKSSKVVKF